MSVKISRGHKRLGSDGLLQLTSGKIEPWEGSDILDVQAITAEGAMDLFAMYKADVDVKVLRKRLREREESLREGSRVQWRQSKPTIFVSHVAAGERAKKALPSESEDLSWVESCDEIVKRLESHPYTSNAFSQTVLIAETTAFNPGLTRRLLGALGQFITQRRFATDDSTITPLGSAIRKYAMNMDPPDFDTYAQWLRPSETEYIHHVTELELVKGVSFRLSFVPVDGTSLELLSKTLDELVGQYLSPRFIVQKNYAATALEGATALIILHAVSNTLNRAEELVDIVKEMERPWFEELLCDQVCEAATFISRHDSALATSVREFAKTLLCS